MKHARKSKKRILLPIFAVAAALLAISAGIYGLFQYLGGDLRYENNVVIGSVDSGKEQIGKMQEMVDRSIITMSINASPVLTLSDMDAGVNWQIENPEEQSTKLIRVELYRDDTNEKIYETGAVKPGSYISGTLPDVELGVGTYPCTAYFYSYDIDTQEYLGQAGAQIILTVLP